MRLLYGLFTLALHCVCLFDPLTCCISDFVENRQLLGETNGVDSLLQALAVSFDSIF